MNGQKAETIFRQSTQKSSTVSGSPWRRMSRASRGQSMVEFAMLSVLALVLMLVGVQFALIGQAAVAVSQGSSALARYAAVNPGTLSSGTASSLPAAAQQLLSTSILTNGGNDLTITVTSKTGTGAAENNPPKQGEQVIINLSYVTTSKIAVPNPFLAVPPLFPGITFPGTVGASDSEMYE
jgi:Flp pilus assembly protein TadG